MQEHITQGPSAEELRHARLIKAIEILPPQDRPGIGKALVKAEEAHAEQKRGSGESFISHPLHVALYLLDFGDPELKLGITDPDV